MSLSSESSQYSDKEPRIFTWIFFNYHWIKWLWKLTGWAIVTIFIYVNYDGSTFAIQNQKKDELASSQGGFEHKFTEYRRLILGNLPKGNTNVVQGKAGEA